MQNQNSQVCRIHVTNLTIFVYMIELEKSYFLLYRKLRISYGAKNAPLWRRIRAIGRCRMRPRWLREFRKRNSLF